MARATDFRRCSRGSGGPIIRLEEVREHRQGMARGERRVEGTQCKRIYGVQLLSVRFGFLDRIGKQDDHVFSTKIQIFLS